MGVPDDASGAVRHDHTGKFVGGEQAAFEVDVPIQERWGQKGSFEVFSAPGFIVAQAGNEPAEESHRSFDDLTGRRIHHAGILQEQVSQALATGYSQQFLQL